MCTLNALLGATGWHHNLVLTVARLPVPSMQTCGMPGKDNNSCSCQHQAEGSCKQIPDCDPCNSWLAVGAHLSLQLLDPALGLRKAVLACYVKHNHRCCSSPAQDTRLQSAFSETSAVQSHAVACHTCSTWEPDCGIFLALQCP